MKYLPAALIIFGLLVEPAAFALNHTSTITRKIGKVAILSNPQKTLNKAAKNPSVFFEGMYYESKKAKRGMQLNRGNVIQTGKASRARLVFENGDQFTVSPKSAYKIGWKVDKKSKPVADIIMGKVRATVRKGGPRSGMKVRTRSAVMGVRGTDFFVTARNKNGESELSVLRGVVDVKPQASKAKPVPVAAGYSAAIPVVKQEPPKAKAVKGKPKKQITKKATPAPIIAVMRTNKQQVVDIQRNSIITGMEPARIGIALAGGPEDDISPAEKARLKKLEQMAVENTISDIKDTDPSILENFKGDTKSITDVDDMLTATTQNAFKAAPAAAASPGKLSEEELQKLNDDAYDKYFKIGK